MDLGSLLCPEPWARTTDPGAETTCGRCGCRVGYAAPPDSKILIAGWEAPSALDRVRRGLGAALEPTVTELGRTLDALEREAEPPPGKLHLASGLGNLAAQMSRDFLARNPDCRAALAASGYAVVGVRLGARWFEDDDLRRWWPPFLEAMRRFVPRGTRPALVVQAGLSEISEHRFDDLPDLIGFFGLGEGGGAFVASDGEWRDPREHVLAWCAARPLTPEPAWESFVCPRPWESLAPPDGDERRCSDCSSTVTLCLAEGERATLDSRKGPPAVGVLSAGRGAAVWLSVAGLGQTFDALAALPPETVLGKLHLVRKPPTFSEHLVRDVLKDPACRDALEASAHVLIGARMGEGTFAASDLRRWWSRFVALLERLILAGKRPAIVVDLSRLWPASDALGIGAELPSLVGWMVVAEDGMGFFAPDRSRPSIEEHLPGWCARAAR